MSFESLNNAPAKELYYTPNYCPPDSRSLTFENFPISLVMSPL